MSGDSSWEPVILTEGVTVSEDWEEGELYSPPRKRTNGPIERSSDVETEDTLWPKAGEEDYTSQYKK